MRRGSVSTLSGSVLAVVLATSALAQPASADRRAEQAVAAMTQAEKLNLVFGSFGSLHDDKPYRPPAQARMGSAGYVPGVPRLSLPPLWETDAGLGVAAQRESPEPLLERTSLPSGLATAATWNPDLAFSAGAMIGAEARASGFNVMLAGGANLARDPRNGRNFEYAGEDPLLVGTMVAAQVRGVQSNHVLSTVKHWALNAQETGRMGMSAHVADDQARVSDFLAFELAIEGSSPGSVMCAYNRVNGEPACESDYLLNQVLKSDWGYRGFVMSDWGAVHSTVKAAKAGLDQESAWSFDAQPYFGAPLAQAVADGQVSQARLDDMALRIVRSMYASGIVDQPVSPGPIDFQAHAAVSRADAEEGLVLLKNVGAILPLAQGARRIVVIGGHADTGVMAGGGSSTVFPVGGNAVPVPRPWEWPGPVVYHRGAPLAAIQARAGDTVRYVDGSDVSSAAKAAGQADLVVVFATQWAAESQDVSLTLEHGQDALIAAVAAANPRTVVVLETGGPVLMPWLDKVSAVIEAWYPGTAGGEAIARVLFGEVDPSGRLPITFPAALSQLPHPALPGEGSAEDAAFSVDYREGAAVGYKWFDKQGQAPLFAFGHGLSYTRFAYDRLSARVVNGAIKVSFTVGNVGDRRGKAVPQVYVAPTGGGWEAPRRLAGWRKVELAPGEHRRLSIIIEPRLLATFDTAAHGWKVAPGTYDIMLGGSSRALGAPTRLALKAAEAPANAAQTLHLAMSGKRQTPKGKE